MRALDSSLLSEKQQKVLDELIAVCVFHSIDVRINEYKNFAYETVSLDVEHNEFGEFVCCGILISGTSVVYCYTDLILLNRLRLHTVNVIAHNGHGDLELLRQWGCNIDNRQLVWDTMLIAHIQDSSRKGFGLKSLVKDILGVEYPSYDDIVGKKTKKQSQKRITLDKQPIEIVSKYNACDVYYTATLYEWQAARGLGRIPSTSVVQFPGGSLPVRSEPQAYFEHIEKPLAGILQQMENRGICVDLHYLEGLKQELEAQKEPIEASIKNELGNINLNSPKQLLEALHAKSIFPEFKGRPSTDKRALDAYKHHSTVSMLLKYSELGTLLSSFVYPYLERATEIVHPFFNQCGTRTGRLSCSNPNLLQIPKKTENGKLVRRMFTPRPGMLLGDCDFGQIEPRVLAHLSKDSVLCNIFNDGTDFHDFTMSRCKISRDRAKVLNLSVGYRATKYSVQRQLGGTLEEAQLEIDKWWDMFPGLRRWQETLIYDAKRSGFCSTLLGRRIKVEGLSDGNPWKREAAERQLINNITQGSAAEIMKMAMIKINICAPMIGLLIQVYDELVFESRADLMRYDMRTVQECMENSIKLDVPLTVDCKIGETWADCK